MPHPKYTELPDYHELVTDEGNEYPNVPDGIKPYSNGAGWSYERKQIVYAPGTFAHNEHAITSSEQGLQMRRRRTELAEEKLRDAISSMTGKEALDAFGEAGAMLWTQVVLNEDAPGRTRMDVMKELGKRMGIVPDRDRMIADKQGASIKVEGLTPQLASQLKELILALRPQAQTLSEHPPEPHSPSLEHDLTLSSEDYETLDD